MSLNDTRAERIKQDLGMNYLDWLEIISQFVAKNSTNYGIHMD